MTAETPVMEAQECCGSPNPAKTKRPAYTCSDPDFDCQTENFVGYPHDGYQNNGDGTYGDGVVNAHDLLDTLGNCHRNYWELPCV